MTGDPAYIKPTEESGRLAFGRRAFVGSVTMLNLVRFRETADYTDFPDLAPVEPISGRKAYEIYMGHTLPFLNAAGGELRLGGEGGHHPIGPTTERWDMVLLVRYPSLEAFMSMTANKRYLAGSGHRTAALVDSRLVPMVEQ